ncbi:MAG: hypothetical protein ABS76_12225 [Pelagibacterium sp. SCN 64-44]|nr:MAG: hypothetical protein ABS76_12225 [Pelagibacterium sp. SCN 64-44]
MAGPLLASSAAWAQDEDFVPETITAKERMDPGPYVFVNQMDTASTIHVYSADDMRVTGSFSGGSWGMFALSKDGQTGYIASGFYSRIAYGDVENVLQIFDVATNRPVKEIILPAKITQYTPSAAQLQLSADEKYIYIQNATPATSVTVVDLEKGEVVQEIPSPGCYGIYPSLEGHAFSTICSDGAFNTFTLSADGTDFESRKSEKIFDVDEDPIYLAFDRAEGDLLFISYHANIYRLSDKDGVIEKLGVTPIAEGVEGNWGTAGYEVVSYNDANGILFVPMAADHHDGSHYHGADEIWAYDLRNDKLLYRSPAEGINSVHVTDDAVPTVFGLSVGDGVVVKYEVDPEAKFVLKKAGENKSFGFATIVMSAP